MLHLNDLYAINFLFEVKNSILRPYYRTFNTFQIQIIKYWIMNRSNEIYALMNTLESAGTRSEALKCLTVIMESACFLKN